MLQELILQIAPVALLCLLIILFAMKIFMMSNVPSSDKLALFFESFKMNHSRVTSSSRKRAFFKKSDRTNRVMYILLGFIVVVWLFVRLN